MAFSACSIVGIRTAEEANYDTVYKDGSFEVRQYSDYISAETTVNEDSWDDASSIGFRRLAGYIFGKNKKQEKLAMTSPVIMSPEQSKLNKQSKSTKQSESSKLDMTAPVLGEKTNQGWKMSFVLPKDVTIENAPEPLDSNVIVSKQSGKKFAVIRFNGSLSDSKFQKYSEHLSRKIQTENLKKLSDPVLAGYDPPWTLPFLKRNEVLIEVK